MTALSYYFFYRAWRVARRRVQGAKSLALHGNLMGLGLVGTASQIPQRMIMAFLIAARGSLLAGMGLVGLSASSAWVRHWITDESCFGWSMFIGPGLTLMLIDGPRSRLTKQAALQMGDRREFHDPYWGSTDAEEKEMYAYDVDSARVRWQWRARLAAFVLARGAATAWWTEQPPPPW